MTVFAWVAYLVLCGWLALFFAVFLLYLLMPSERRRRRQRWHRRY